LKACPLDLEVVSAGVYRIRVGNPRSTKAAACAYRDGSTMNVRIKTRGTPNKRVVFSMFRRARVIATIAGLAVYGRGSSARAQGGGDVPVSLSWVTPNGSGCPDAAYVLAEIRRYVGAGVANHRAPVSATATIRADEAGGFQLILKTADGETSGERAFRDESCRALADATVVILAWMVAPGAMATRSLTAHGPGAPALPPVPIAPAPSPALKAVGPTPYVGLGAAADLGALPGPALGAEARVGIFFRRLRLEGRAGYWPTQRKSIAALASGDVPGATFTLWNVGLQACLEAFAQRSTSRIGLALCAGPEIDVLNGAGFGVTVPARANTTWFSISAAIEGRMTIAGRVKAFSSFAAVIPTQREHFALRGVGELYRPSALGGRGILGVELEL
jgi:hypothetical protein